jgi:hypothetical protein
MHLSEKSLLPVSRRELIVDPSRRGISTYRRSLWLSERKGRVKEIEKAVRVWRQKTRELAEDDEDTTRMKTGDETKIRMTPSVYQLFAILRSSHSD